MHYQRLGTLWLCKWLRLWLHRVIKSRFLVRVIFFADVECDAEGDGAVITDESLRTHSHMNKYASNRILGLQRRATSAFGSTTWPTLLTKTFIDLLGQQRQKSYMACYSVQSYFFDDVASNVALEYVASNFPLTWNAESCLCWRDTSTWNVTAVIYLVDVECD